MNLNHLCWRIYNYCKNIADLIFYSNLNIKYLDSKKPSNEGFIYSYAFVSNQYKKSFRIVLIIGLMVSMSCTRSIQVSKTLR